MLTVSSGMFCILIEQLKLTTAFKIRISVKNCLGLMAILKYQHKLVKMRAELANLNHCAVPFLSAPVPTCAGTTLVLNSSTDDESSYKYQTKPKEGF